MINRQTWACEWNVVPRGHDEPACEIFIDYGGIIMSNRRKARHSRRPPTRARVRGVQSRRRQSTPSPQGVLAGALGFCMAQKAVEIMARHRDRLTMRPNADGTIAVDWDFPAPDGALLVTILEAANDCWGVVR